MLTSDRRFKEAKWIKTGRRSIPLPYSELAQWIEAKYSVRVLNVSCSVVEAADRPRLSVDLDTEEDQQVFERSRFVADSDKASAILEKFKEIAEREALDVSLKGMFVHFAAFEPAARGEANGRVPEKSAAALAEQFPEENLWCVQKAFDSVVVFYDSESEARDALERGMVEQYLKVYSRIVAPYDEFGYLSKTPIVPRIDSKENFDKNFESSWFYYWR